MEREFQQHVYLKRELSQAVKWRGQKTISACLRVAIPFPPKVKRKRGNVYANLTLLMFRDVTLFQENI